MVGQQQRRGDQEAGAVLNDQPGGVFDHDPCDRARDRCPKTQEARVDQVVDAEQALQADQVRGGRAGGSGGHRRGGRGKPGQSPADPLGAVSVQDAALADRLYGRRTHRGPGLVARLGLDQLLGCEHVRLLVWAVGRSAPAAPAGLFARLSPGGARPVQSRRLSVG
jgi:hypothetical protein